MSNHSQRTHRGPSVTSIVVMGAATLAASIVSFWTLSGEVMDQRHIAGFLMGLALTMLLVAQTSERIHQRQLATDRLKARADQVRRERIRNTGTWLGLEPGQQLTVRWDEPLRRYLVQGWMSKHTFVEHERPWQANLDDLAELLTDIERSRDMTPVADEGTQLIRARLGVEEDDAPEPDPVATQPTGTEPAHVQRLPVPVKHEHDGPTHNLTSQARRFRNTWGDRP